VEPILLADAEDRHDVGVVQLGGRASLSLETFDLRRIGNCVSGEDLERDSPAEGFLLGLVDDPHAAAAGLAQQPEVAKPLQARAPDDHGSRVEIAGGVARAGLQVVEHQERGKCQADLVGQIGVGGGVLLDRGILAQALLLDEFVSQRTESFVGSSGSGYFAPSALSRNPGKLSSKLRRRPRARM
jgi:hypothetical protein